MDYIEIKLKGGLECESEISDFLASKDIFSYEIVTPKLIDELEQNKNDWDFVDDDFFDNMNREIIFKVYFDKTEKERANELAEEALKLGISAEFIGVDKKDWAYEWRKFYKPIELGESIAIVPSWEDYENVDGRKIITIDPGMAFGTGGHETTSMCIEKLEKHMDKGATVFDIGCGSGILSLVASKLGASFATGIDIDPVCVSNSYDNAKLNDIENVKFIEGDLATVLTDAADVVVSNIIAQIIMKLIPDVHRILKPNGLMIFSGIIEKYESLVIDALETENYDVVEIERKNGWVVIVARRDK